jgi:hypothetical protein
LLRTFVRTAFQRQPECVVVEARPGWMSKNPLPASHGIQTRVRRNVNHRGQEATERVHRVSGARAVAQKLNDDHDSHGYGRRPA